jgi:hypothetical protein
MLEIHFVANYHNLSGIGYCLIKIFNPIALIFLSVRTEWKESLESMLKTTSTPWLLR